MNNRPTRTVALTQKDVGVTVGSGAAVALSAASVVLVRDSLLDIVAAVLLSRTTLWRIRINFLAASLYNIVAIPVAAGILVILSAVDYYPIEPIAFR